MTDVLEVTYSPHDLLECDGCGLRTDQWVSCLHGQSRCPDCGLCNHCAVEARRP